MSSDESDNEEKNAIIQDALQCNFIQQIFDTVYKPTVNSNIPSALTKPKESKVEHNFEGNIAKILAGRLDKKIQEITIPSQIPKSTDDSDTGIRLFSSSRIITNADLIKPEKSIKSKKSLKKKKIDLEKSIELYEKQALESAVSSQWVHSELNTKYWCDNKKQRIVKMKTVKKLGDCKGNGSIVCTVLSDES